MKACDFDAGWVCSAMMYFPVKKMPESWREYYAAGVTQGKGGCVVAGVI